jgi:hypothetical protein
MPLLVVSMDGATIDTIGEFAGALRSVDAGSAAPTPTLSPSAVFTVDTDRFVVGNAIEHELSIINAAGSILRRYRWRGEDLRVPETDHEAWRQGLLETAYTEPGQDPSYVLGIWRDSLHVDYVRMYPLIKR